MPTVKEPMTVKEFFVPNNFETEKSYIGKEWWYVKNLVKEAESQKLRIFELDLLSIDLGVMPWDLKSILHFAEHMADIEACDLEHPVILAPSGWVMNGWHRIIK